MEPVTSELSGVNDLRVGCVWLSDDVIREDSPPHLIMITKITVATKVNVVYIILRRVFMLLYEVIVETI
jgi:hypothetical protein